MKNTVFLFMLGIALSIGDVQAQGILGKLKNAADKVTKTLDKGKSVISGDGEVAKLSESGLPKPKGTKSNLYELLHASNRPEMVNNINSKFANFKRTANTKVVTLDGLNHTKLGFYFDNRAIVATEKNGTYCFDERGNVVKHWDKNENPQRRGLIGNSYIKFSSNRLINMTNTSTSNRSEAIIYDQNFNVVKKIPDVSFASDYEDGVAIVVTNKLHSNTSIISSYNHYVDVNGNFVFKELTEPIDANRMTLNNSHIRSMHDGLAAFCVPMGSYKMSPWGFRDSNGKAIVLAQYQEVQDFCNGQAAVCTDGKWGFIDTKGNMVIPQRYSVEPSKFDDCGMALVVNREGKYMFIDKSGNVVSKEYDRITPFCNGKALCAMDNGTPNNSDDDYTVMLDSKFNVVSVISDAMLVFPDKTTCMQFYGKSTLSTDNEKRSRYVDGDERIGSLFIHDGHFYLHVDGCGYCFLSETGDVVIAGLAGPFINGIAPVYDNGLHPKNIGYVNMKGEWVIKFELSEF